MKSSKVFKVFLAIIALLLAGFFIWYLLVHESNKIIPPNPEPGVKIDERYLPNSVIFKKDLSQGTLIPDEGESWQNQNFTRYISDIVYRDSELDKCFYYIYDYPKKIFSAAGERKCNANLTITVGEGKNCSSQGENTCFLHVYAKDKNGNEGNTMTNGYSIDFEAPVIGKVFTKENETYPIRVGKGEKKIYQAEVSDAINVDYCWFFFDLNYISATLSPSLCENGKKCIASAEYALEEGTHSVFVRCADRYSAETGKYFNIKDGETAKIDVFTNHPPVISSCRVSPTQGSVLIDFRFEAIADDPDHDNLSYRWEFGDGNYSNEKNPVHNYKDRGTYEPKVTASDSGGLQYSCSTAWVSISE
jgi:hypothetical protein